MKTDPQSVIPSFPAGEFKAKCLKLLDEAVIKQQGFSITKRGKIAGHLTPVSVEEKPFRSVIGRSRGIRIPTEAEWAKLKAEWADEWDHSTKNFESDFAHSKGKKK